MRGRAGWLQDFAYRVPISWWIYGIAGVSAVVIALATVSVQALRAAMANPVESLRGWWRSSYEPV
jgi:putative ABC transport system permease protein